jgi:hypothetical protein
MFYSKLTRNEKVALEILFWEYPKHKSYAHIIRLIQRSVFNHSADYGRGPFGIYIEYENWSNYYIEEKLQETLEILNKNYPQYKGVFYYES